MGALRRGVTWVFRRFMPVYFRRIEVIGEVPGEGVRGRLFVSNHVNGILDPILVFIVSGSDISPVAKSTLWSVPVLRWLLGVVDSVQIVRRVDDPAKQGGSNDHVFDQVAAWMRGGGNILIFPEGTSHSQPHLVEIKSGAARMLLRACELGAPDALTIQPVAMEFDAREEARSRVLLIFGPPWRASDLPETKAIAAPDASPSDVTAFLARVTERIRADLSDRLVEGATWEERRVIGLAAEMLANDAGDSSLAVWNAKGRTVKEALRAAGEGESAEARRSLKAYLDELAAIGISDAEVATSAGSEVSALVLAVTAPLGAIGLITHALPRFATSWIADRVKSKDETGTFRLGAALVFHPVWTGLLVGASLAFAPSPWRFLLAALSVIGPFASLPWIDALPVLRRRLRARRAKARLGDLRRARGEALSRLNRLLSSG